jgi:hypothetical protein
MNPIDLYHDENWCPEEYRGHLQNAVAFRRELGTKCRVPAICIFGYGIQTPARAALENRNSTGGWDQIRFMLEDKGDSTVPAESAYLPNGEIHLVHQHHAALYMDNDVKMRLKMERTRWIAKRRSTLDVVRRRFSVAGPRLELGTFGLWAAILKRTL